MFKRIDHVEIIPKDLERAVAFYGDILGFKLKERIKIGRGPLEEVVFMTLGDTMLEIVSIKDPAPLAEACVGYRMMALEVEDMDKAVAYLKSKGVPIVVEPVVLVDGSKRGEIKDPDGLGIELRQW